jgi:nucleosome binding factor SPN SPT16 subunit
MYFGLAFCRVGLDFRVLMVPIFEEAILNQIKKSLDSANVKFEESLAKINWSELFLEINLKKEITALNGIEFDNYILEFIYKNNFVN